MEGEHSKGEKDLFHYLPFGLNMWFLSGFIKFLMPCCLLLLFLFVFPHASSSDSLVAFIGGAIEPLCI